MGSIADCRVLDDFFYYWNPPADESGELLGPLSPRLAGTRTSAALADRRALMAADWLVRTHAPAWLRLAGLDASADALSALPEITSVEHIPSVREPVEVAWKDIDVARDSVKDKDFAITKAEASDVANDLFRDSAGQAALAAVWSGPGVKARTIVACTTAESRGGVWDKVGVISIVAAKHAAEVGAPLEETRHMLQQSAVELAERMIECSEA